MPQIIIATIMGLNFVTAIINHGKDKGVYNAYTAVADLGITASLLYWGGFF